MDKSRLRNWLIMTRGDFDDLIKELDSPPEPDYTPLGELLISEYPNERDNLVNGGLIIAKSCNNSAEAKYELHRLHHDYTCYREYQQWRMRFGGEIKEMSGIAQREIAAIDADLAAGPVKP